MPTATDVRIIKGPPCDKWDEVQGIQNEPFIYIQSNGSRWAGEEPGDIAELLEVMAAHKLNDYGAPEHCSVDPCTWQHNPDWTSDSVPDVPKYIDGERLYSCDGVVRFCGNFETVSHVFNIDTNHKPTIDALVFAIAANKTLIAENRA